MAGMRLRILTTALALLLPGCLDSCDCGSHAGSSRETGSVADPQAPNQAAGGHGRETDAQSLAANEKRLAQLEAMRVQLAPLPEGEEREKLARAASAIDGTADLGEPIQSERILSTLPERVGEYKADGSAKAGSTPAGAGTATVIARQYRSGASIMNVKVTDTADAPDLRRELSEQLVLVGNKPSGNQEGRVEDGVPGVVAYHADARANRAMALIGGRYLVEVMVHDAPSTDVAWGAVMAIDRKPLSR